MGNRRFPAQETQGLEATHTTTNSEKAHNRSGSRIGDHDPIPPGNEAHDQPLPELDRLLVAFGRDGRLLVPQTSIQAIAPKRERIPKTSFKVFSDTESLKPGRYIPLSPRNSNQMYKKLFGIVLIAHLLAFGYLGLRTDDSPYPKESEVLEQPPSSSDDPSLEDEDDLLETVKPKLDKPIPLEFDASSTTSLPDSIRSDDLGTGLLVEIPSGRILWQKDSAQPVGIASMTKMMTALLAFEDIRDRDEIDFQTQVKVTNAAYRIGGSQVWLDPRETFALDELLISVMVKSANDSAYLVGEFLAGGNMNQFVERMNERAKTLNMSSTRFFNAHGLPETKADNTANCEDLARLANELLQYDQAIEWASMQKYAFRANAKEPTLLANHNRLITSTIGVDGMKTGYTKRAGYCITATCLRNERRLIAVTTGFDSGKRRDAFTRDLLDWGYTLP